MQILQLITKPIGCSQCIFPILNGKPLRFVIFYGLLGILYFLPSLDHVRQYYDNQTKSTNNILQMGCVKSNEIAPTLKGTQKRQTLVINFRQEKKGDKKQESKARDEEGGQKQQGQEMRMSGKPVWSQPQFLKLPQQKHPDQLQSSPVVIIYSSDKDNLPDLRFTSLQSIPPPPPQKRPLTQIQELQQQNITSAEVKKRENWQRQQRMNNIMKVGVNDIIINESMEEGEVCEQQMLDAFKFVLPKVEIAYSTVHSH